MKKAEILFCAVLIASAALAIYFAVDYRFMTKGRIDAGFLPICMAVLLLAVSVLNVLKVRKSSGGQDAPFFVNKEGKKHVLVYLVGIALLVIAIEIIGMLPASLVFLFCFYYFFDKKPLKNSILVSVGTTLVLFLIFNVWLDLSLPMGLLG